MIVVTEQYNGAPGTPQTWSWDGADWTQKTLVGNPTRHFAVAMAFDAARQQKILFGGADVVLLAETWALLAPSANLVPPAPVLSKSGAYDLVTVVLKNQGNIPITSISITSAKVGGVAAIPITPTTLTSFSPGATASFTVEVLAASLPGTTASLAFQGIYSTATTGSAAWTGSVRSVTLP